MFKTILAISTLVFITACSQVYVDAQGNRYIETEEGMKLIEQPGN